MANPNVNIEALKTEIRQALVNQKANACPMAIRLAWHSSGTFAKDEKSGGSDGATMRFEPESADDANAGLGIIRDLLLPVKQRHPEVSFADLWTLAGAAAVEITGGPSIPHSMCRSDAADGKACPAIGRLPDAAQGAQHLRDVFYRQGFNDQEIVALSGAHTLGRCHKSRSGFDGPWTRSPLRFNNAYFKHLLDEEWVKRDWDGNEQFMDKKTGELMMLPTDVALITDEKFLPFVKLYASDETAFFNDFAAVFGKLIGNGTKTDGLNSVSDGITMDNSKGASADFREHAMHGSLIAMKRAQQAGGDVHSTEGSSGRTALHKAAFWGHDHLMSYMLDDCKMSPDAQDFSGDTALHDAARFGHVGVVKALLAGGANKTVKNKEGKTAAGVALAQDKEDVAALISGIDPRVNIEALKTEIRSALINQKANACPMAIRLAWHASGTYSKDDATGGSDGATMRFEPECLDDANAGLSMLRDMLLPVKQRHPEVSFGDLWTLAGATAVEMSGGPRIPHKMCRSDAVNGKACPVIGRLPDAAQGAQHLRDVFYRQGFNDQEIVALSGAHTLGRCHKSRSGFDGPWTRSPLRFNNAYFKHLLEEEWVKRDWDGNEQFMDKKTGELMMLPTDVALLEDAKFLPFVKLYAADEQAFFNDFAAVFGKLMGNGTAAAGAQNSVGEGITMDNSKGASADFREHAMHGSLIALKSAKNAGGDPHSLEASSGRTALHKAAFWGHGHLMCYLLQDCKVNVDAQDFSGDTALHDAARFGHTGVVTALLGAGASKTVKNKQGKDALTIAREQEKKEVALVLG